MEEIILQGNKKCAYCGKELAQDEIKDYFENDPKYQNMVYQGLISEEEQCIHCGYHNVFIEKENLTVSKP